MTFYSASKITNCNKKKVWPPSGLNGTTTWKDSGMPRNVPASTLCYRYISILLVFLVFHFGLILPSLYEFIPINSFSSVGRRCVPQQTNIESKKIPFCWDVTRCYWSIKGQYVLDLSRIYWRLKIQAIRSLTGKYQAILNISRTGRVVLM